MLTSARSWLPCCMLQRAASLAMVVVLPAPVGPTTAMMPPLTVLSRSTTGRCLTSSASGNMRRIFQAGALRRPRRQRHGDVRRDVHGRQLLEHARLQRLAQPLVVPATCWRARSRSISRKSFNSRCMPSKPLPARRARGRARRRGGGRRARGRRQRWRAQRVAVGRRHDQARDRVAAPERRDCGGCRRRLGASAGVAAAAAAVRRAAPRQRASRGIRRTAPRRSRPPR